MEYYLTESPVLFVVFNRLDTTKKVFQEIRKARPKKLFVYADGPRDEEEKKKTDKVREYIMNNIDWNCWVTTNFRKENLGCKYAVSGAIDWFFEHVKEGIILEDDCLPSQSFFKFCDAMLERHRDDEDIMHISGTNVEGVSNIEDDYFLSKTFNVWGWATWKRAWDYYDVELSKYENRNSMRFLDRLNYSLLQKYISKRKYKKTKMGEIDTWDYQWDFDCKYNDGYSIIPRKNLIMNIGIGKGTHTTRFNRYKILPIHKMSSFKIKNVIPKYRKDYLKEYNSFFETSLFEYFIKLIS